MRVRVSLALPDFCFTLSNNISMGISSIKKKLLNETNNLYSEDEIKEFQQLSREQGLDIVEYVKSISNKEEEELLKQFNSFSGEVTSYIDWKNKRTRET